MFDTIATAFGYILNAIYNLVNNYGIAIIIFTILLKVIMLPISINQQKTLKKSTKIQAKTKELQEKYGSDQVRLSQELMNLYKEENMSPFSGCLSSIVQILIILSIFFLVSRPLTYMKQIDSEKINKYTEELRASGERVNYPEIAIIKAKSNEDESVKINMNFLGLDLSDIPSQDYSDPKVFIIPVLYVLTSLVSMKITNSMNKTNEKKEEPEKTTGKELVKKENDDEIDAMEEMNRNMSLMMPIMSVSIALIAPLGLALYWLVSNLLMILERIFMNKIFKEKEEEVVKNG